MPKYAILYNPGHNRVYFETSKNLASIELAAVGKNIKAVIVGHNEKLICGVAYLMLETKDALHEDDLLVLSRLSFFYALFEISEQKDDIMLRPVLTDTRYFMDPSVTRILKYSGKTNEIFTRMMLNVALGYFDAPDKKDIKDHAGKNLVGFAAVF